MASESSMRIDRTSAIHFSREVNRVEGSCFLPLRNRRMWSDAMFFSEDHRLETRGLALKSSGAAAQERRDGRVRCDNCLRGATHPPEKPGDAKPMRRCATVSCLNTSSAPGTKTERRQAEGA